MVNSKYAIAYKEVLIVINNLVKEDYDKIPKEYIKFLENNCDKEYEFEYDTSKTFNEQNLQDDTKYILFGLFEKFGATDIQKQKIKNFKINYNNKLEQEKSKKHNPDDIFKGKSNDEGILINNNIPSQNALIKVRKPNIIQKIVSKIKKILHFN